MYVMAVGVAAVMLTSRLQATVIPSPVFVPDTTFYHQYPYIRFVEKGDTIAISDEAFYDQSARLPFAVNQYRPNINDPLLRELNDRVLPRINADSLELAYIIIRGAASPEGHYLNNKTLGQKRAQALISFLRQRMLFNAAERDLSLDTEPEDYRTLALMMLRNGDHDYPLVQQLCDQHLPTGDYANLKLSLQSAGGGALWRRLLRDYFPALRTARIMLFFRRATPPRPETVPMTHLRPIAPLPRVAPADTAAVGWLCSGVAIGPLCSGVAAATASVATAAPRREMLSVKTNLLMDFAYMPGYNRWCPMPNIAIEYYPKRGHITYGASFDMPWWQDYDAHKYFQVRNYQVETRYYLRANGSGPPTRPPPTPVSTCRPTPTAASSASASTPTADGWAKASVRASARAMPCPCLRTATGAWSWACRPASSTASTTPTSTRTLSIPPTATTSITTSGHRSPPSSRNGSTAGTGSAPPASASP